MEQEREEIQLRRQQEEELRLKLKLHRQHEQALENERKKADADEEQRQLCLELREGSSRASGSKVEDLESFGSRRNLERTAGWANSVAPHSKPPKNFTLDKMTNVSVPTQKLSFVSTKWRIFQPSETTASFKHFQDTRNH